MNKLLIAIVYLAILELVLATPSHAYLDPGTGSMLLQALAAAFIGISIFWRRIVNGLRSRFNKKNSRKS